MEYLFILAAALLIILLISVCKIKEGLKAGDIEKKAEESKKKTNDVLEKRKKFQLKINNGMNIKKLLESQINFEGFSEGMFEKKETSFDLRKSECQNIVSCSELDDKPYCGYCLEDDKKGNAPFHYGDKNGPFDERGDGASKLCISKDGVDGWIKPKNVQKDASKICEKVRTRFACRELTECGPNNIIKFQRKDKSGKVIKGSGINLADKCGLCVDDGKSYARKDLPPYGKNFTKKTTVMKTKCTNVEIFGDGVDCESYNKDRVGCLNQKAKNDNTINACAFSYKKEEVPVQITIPKPSEVKYNENENPGDFDKCNSEWGLIRPDQCSWFEQAYPCLKTKSGGNHSDECLDSLWTQTGFIQNPGFKAMAKEKTDNKKDIYQNKWKEYNVDDVGKSMNTAYNKMYSGDYKTANKWLNITYGLKANICNRDGLQNEKYNNSKYWDKTPQECLSKLYKYGGGQEGGLANPKNKDKMGWGRAGYIENFECNTNDYSNIWRTRNFNENKTDQQIFGSEVAGKKIGCAEKMSHKDYINFIRELNKNRNMSVSDSKKVDDRYEVYRKRRKNRNSVESSNIQFVNKYQAEKLITGKEIKLPIDGEKPCWPSFARNMLSHPNVELKNLKTLSFRKSSDFHHLSYTTGWNKKYENYYKNVRKSGERLFSGGRNYEITQETYENHIFPFWRFLEIMNNYWKIRWNDFTRILKEYSGTSIVQWKDFWRPTDSNIAKQLIQAKGLKLGGGGTNWIGNYGTKGLYYYPPSSSSRYGNRAYFGTRGNSTQMKSNLNSSIKRLDEGKNMEILRFDETSRFFESLDSTINLNYALSGKNNDFFLFELLESGKKVRYLFKEAYEKGNFKEYDKFLVKASKN